MPSEATPRPLRLFPSDFDEVALWAPKAVAFTLDTAHFSHWQEVRERRDYIVHAVNSHDALVEAAERMVDLQPCNCTGPYGECATCQMNRALALARGEEKNDE